MNTGQVISAAGHATLIGWMMFGGVFRSETLPIEATEVSVISGEAFAALVAAQNAPSSTTEVAQPVQPEIDTEAVDVPQPDTTPVQETPDVAAAPAADDAPDVSDLAPLPDAEVSDEVPILSAPEPEVVVDVPDISERPVPRPSIRIAPEPVAVPEPDARPDPVEQPAVVQAETGETVAEPQDATAPEEAADEIVTEAEKPTAAPETSVRPPPRRPTRLAVQAAETSTTTPTPSPTPQTEPADTSSAVNDALAEALGQATETPSAPSGPPLTSGEKDALRVAVQQCWNVGSLSSVALETTVVVAVSLSQDGKPVTSSIRQIGSEGGTATSVKQAFETARRAIIRCGARGFQLPGDKYEQWKDIEMTFNPERMRIK
ncbi:MAG: hypothetical protein ACI9KK_001131 [Ascidiaceihabitans sp.]